jgi:transcriptional regulator with XRE-family HTH domain
MSEIGRKLLMIRKQRKLSLRQVEKLTVVIANRYGDKARRISASWLGRIERESHSITHKRLESLAEVYGVTHDELTSEAVPEDEVTRSLHSHFPDVPVAVLKGLTGLGRALLPPESWLAYFPLTTLLPPLSRMAGDGRRVVRRHSRGAELLYGILGAGDNTLVPFVQPRAIVEINTAVRTIEPEKVFHSIFERPIYFLRSHDGYHCGWCGLDAEEQWLTLVPSAVTMVSQRRWRYRREVEVIGLVNRVLTRVGFPENLWFDRLSSHKRSNST